MSRFGRNTLILLGFALPVFLVGVVAVPAEEPRVERDHRVRIVIVDDDGDRQEEVIELRDGEPRPFLGVNLGRADDGALIEQVIEETAAARAGLREGDVIVGFDGATIETPWDLTREVLRSEPGRRVDVDLIRDGRPETLSVEVGETDRQFGSMSFGFDSEAFGEQMKLLERLGEFDFEWDAEGFAEQMGQLGERLGNMEFDFEWDAEGFAEQMERLGEGLENMQFDLDDHGMRYRHWVGTSQRPLLGVELVETTPELRRHLGGDEDAGILVGKVLSGTAAEQAGLRVGDLIVSVDGEPIEDAGDLRRALHERRGEIFDLEVVRDGARTSLAVEIPDADEDEDPRGSGYHQRMHPVLPAGDADRT